MTLERRVFSGPQPPGAVGCCGPWTSASTPQNFMEVSCPGCFKNLFRSDQSVGLKKSLTMPLSFDDGVRFHKVLLKIPNSVLEQETRKSSPEIM